MCVDCGGGGEVCVVTMGRVGVGWGHGGRDGSRVGEEMWVSGVCASYM